MNVIRAVLLGFILISSYNYKAQVSNDEKIARQFFQNREFEKAELYYQKIYDNTQSENVYTEYLTCLIEQKKFDLAEKIVKKKIKHTQHNALFQFDLGKVYAAQGQQDKASKIYATSIKSLIPDQNQILALAQQFYKANELDYVIETYKKGRKLLQGSYTFNIELAEIYRQKGDIFSMVNECLDLLDLEDSYIQSVQDALQINFGQEADAKKNEIIRQQLLKRIQQNPEKTIFTELLVWMLMQEKEYEQAYIHVKALDNRKNEQGSRIINFAQICVANDAFETAEKCYNYLLEKGQEQPFYKTAFIELLNVNYKKLQRMLDPPMLQWVELESKNNQAFTLFGQNTSTFSIIKNQVQVMAFYLHKTSQAINFLQEAISNPLISPHNQSELKLILGDIQLATGSIWDASLIYSQVEKAYKYDQIGQEAKFRNAKIAFYTGDFKWAQAQLDVLKGSTTKLISNDAMALSILISDNLGWDSIATPLEMYARANLNVIQNNSDQALLIFDSIIKAYPDRPIIENIELQIADIQIKKQQFTEALTTLQKITTGSTQNVYSDKAFYKMALICEDKLNDKEQALKYFNQLLVKYPGSIYTIDARNKYRKLRGDQLTE